MIIPYHRHSVSAFTGNTDGGHSHTYTTYSGGVNSPGTNGNLWYLYKTVNTGGTGAHTHTIPAHNTNYAGTSGNTTNANIPNYKSVYIWERTV